MEPNIAAGPEPQASVQSTPESNFEPKKSLPKWPLIIAGIILIATILLTGAYFLGQKSNNKVACTTEAKICPDGSSVGRTGPKCEFSACPKTPTPTPNPTATWKTYVENDYSIKIPGDWINADSGGLVRFLNYDETKAPGRDFVPALDKGKLKIEIYRTTIDQDLQTYVNSITQNNPNGEFKTLNLTLDGKPAIEISNNTNFTIFVKVPSRNNILSIGFYLDFINNKTLASQIASTFKFTDQTTQATTLLTPTPTIDQFANWKDYSDLKYNFTFKYPADWTTQTKDYPTDNQRLVNIIKNSSPSVVSLSFTITNGWDRGQFGNAQDQPKNYSVGGVSAYRLDPPTKEQQTLERYQTNVYFEAPDGHVYVFICTHNWNQDYINTCNNILSSFKFTP